MPATATRSSVTTELPAPDAVQPELVIVGPEDALVAGVADECARRGVPCFGPTAELARLEGSKAHARDVAARLGIPSPAFAAFAAGDAGGALAWWRAFDRPIVVKQSGLAAGKGVVVPADEHETQAAIEQLVALGPIVLEERLHGTECSLIALCDGRIAVGLPLAQDHKRIGEGDTGLNTGGMGAFVPAPVPWSSAELTAQFVQPVVDAFAAAGTPYVGVLYAGLMLTADGPKLLEWNCRFGDPETQALLPLLDIDLAAVAMSCTRGRLAPADVRIRPGAACTVVAASGAYPSGASEPAPIDGITATVRHGVVTVPGATTAGGGDSHVFLAGASVAADGTVTATGGRVLAVTGQGRRPCRCPRCRLLATGEHLVRRACRCGATSPGGLPGAHCARTPTPASTSTKERVPSTCLKASVERTHTPAVLQGVGSFGGAFDVSSLKDFARPILVASTDGVGTKVELAARAGRPEVSGMDIVNHCVGDVLVQGARPLFFLDYIAASHLDPSHVASVVDGMAKACEASGCVLLGGETAEMPGVYVDGAFDVAGTLVGVVEHARMLPRGDVGPGDLLVGLASSGPHTNGYSLLRKLFAWIPLDARPEPLDRPLGDALLAPHRSYLAPLAAALDTGKVKALAHITGGGLPENVPRILPPAAAPASTSVRGRCRRCSSSCGNWRRGCRCTSCTGRSTWGSAWSPWCAAEDLEAVQRAIGEDTWVIGELVAGRREVELCDVELCDAGTSTSFGSGRP